jgi:hypothetical protein
MELLKFSTRTAQLNAQKIVFQPINPELFFDKSKHDRFTTHIDSLQLNRFDILAYHKYRLFIAGSLVINGGKVAIFNNPKRKDSTHADATDRSATFPNAGIYRLKTDLKIDTIQLNHIDINYTELSNKSHKTGYVNFNNTSGTILNLTTNAAALQKNNNCTMALNSYFMNKGRLDANFKFNLTDKALPYSYNGHLGPVNLNVVNTAAASLAMVKIKSGKLKSLDFDIQGNRYGSKGKVALLYNDLKVTLLKPDTMQKKLKRMPLESFYANIFIIKHDNPSREGEAPRIVYVNEPRPPEFAFFKTIWKTLLSGMRQCAGYGAQKEREIKSQMADRAIAKKEHKLKKAERKQKREEKKLAKELKNRQPE